jgi:uncharacterized membrane protein YfcA
LMGTLAGVLGSLAGMGGGFVMIPMMTAARRSIVADAAASSKGPTTMPSWWRGGLGLSQHEAHGTSLFAVGTTGLAGALGYGIRAGGGGGDDDVDGEPSVAAAEGAPTTTTESRARSTTTTTSREGRVELDAALALALSAAITARFGAIASSKLSGRTLQRALGAYMIAVAPLVPARAYYLREESSRRDLEAATCDPATDGVGAARGCEEVGRPPSPRSPPPPLERLERLLPISIVGLFSGFLSGMFGVGGGTIAVPSLVLATDMPYHSALGTSLCAMALPAAVGTHANARLGNVNWRVAPFLAAGSAAGAYAGARGVGSNVDEGVLKLGFSCLMLVLGVRTWRKGSR